LQLFYNTGIRQAELVSLKENQVDYFKKTIKVLGKGNKERIIPVSSELLGILRDYVAEKRKLFEDFDNKVLLISEKGKPLYPKYVYNAVKKYLSKITTISKKSPHVLRHTFATHLMNNGADLNAVKELLGHSSLAATQIYTHNSIEKLKDIHKKAHPKA
jgi:integrase/recombinase XerC